MPHPFREVFGMIPAELRRATGEIRGQVQRAVLPIPDRPHTGLTTYDAKD